MTTTLFITFGIIIGGILAYFIFRNKGKSGSDIGALSMLQSQINELTKMMEYKLGESNKAMTDTIRHQSSESSRLVADITERLTRLDETNKQVISFTEQLEDLQSILKNPKQRGILGEYYLETLLKNVLPPGSYQMQYAFDDENIVDAVVFVKDKIIPIDSKFSLENYNRAASERDPAERERLEKVFVNDLKNRIVETSKYIKPAENTMDFAFMFIPHEAIYYDLLVNKIGGLQDDNENLIQRAASKYKVIIVSPTSFLAYLQTVLQGLKAMQIEESAKDIIKRVGELGKHLKGYEDYHNKLGSALGTVVNHYTTAGKQFKLIEKDVFKISGESMDIELELLEKPSLDTE